MEMHANSREDVKEARAGDIIAIAGLKDVVTGDTLCDEKAPVLLERMDFPDPVIKVGGSQRVFFMILRSLGQSWEVFWAVGGLGSWVSGVAVRVRRFLMRAHVRRAAEWCYTIARPDSPLCCLP
jgi:hypothetical protein